LRKKKKTKKMVTKTRREMTETRAGRSKGKAGGKVPATKKTNRFSAGKRQSAWVIKKTSGGNSHRSCQVFSKGGGKKSAQVL